MSAAALLSAAAIVDINLSRREPSGPGVANSGKPFGSNSSHGSGGGRGDFLIDGHTDYGSLGQGTIVGSVPPKTKVLTTLCATPCSEQARSHVTAHF